MQIKYKFNVLFEKKNDVKQNKICPIIIGIMCISHTNNGSCIKNLQIPCFSLFNKFIVYYVN